MTTRLEVKKGSNLPKVKAENLSVVLDALRKLQPISRSDLAEATGLTAATITHLVDELNELKILIETRSDSKQVGRRPTLLTLNPERGQIVGVEISRSTLHVVRTDFCGRVLDRLNVPHDPNLGLDYTLALLYENITSMIDSRLELLGIGIGVPGPVNSREGIVLGPPNFGGWRNVHLAQMVSEKFGVPCWLDDDAKTAALGERWFGSGKNGTGTLLYVSFRAGVGAGLIVKDHIFRGAHELAGEIGHTTIHVDGPLCECGNRGCVETLVSVPAIMLEAARLGLKCKNARELEALAQEGSQTAKNIKERTYQYIAATVVNAINHYDPDMIVLGGTLVRAWPDFIECVTEKVRGRSFGFLSKDVNIVRALLGSDASAVGAAALVVEQIFQEPQAQLQR
ncbi:ROK family transcriptional regulator [Deinococcus cellulosilyticus]|uniref:Xylose repressor n=1 Tax=Deinococcus cellulosilyticus (strain DSM 18568 / NBRC 106333 / KACC 11606 / 5516J-15) TaxID=1223518 RepID=A0A511N327_DEIC1|nr:ROK family transcriptional regulator [Deinococcus cellulosilyticus]GEM47254.1 xylose repressor [Deinococcus cellulosilyticus NBRC 106333 = KACC 11606]